MSDTLELAASVEPISRSRIAVYIELTKPRIATLSLISAGVGCYMGMPQMPSAGAAAMLLVTAILGIGLVAAGANTLNQYVERDFDARMPRTAGRPLPSGRLTLSEVLAFGVGTACAGVLILALLVNLLSSVLAAATLLCYVFLYTPLKRIAPMCVFVGAVAGALPPVIGWAAGAGNLSIGAWFLFAVIFFWQLPHFAAIAWMYQDQYAAAGYRVQPAGESAEIRINLHVVTHSVGLLGATLMPAMYGMAGWTYAIGAVTLGLLFLASGVAFISRKSGESARFHLMASVVYLPLLCALLVADKAQAF